MSVAGACPRQSLTHDPTVHHPPTRRTHETEIKDTSERAFVGFDIQQDAEEERARVRCPTLSPPCMGAVGCFALILTAAN